MTFSPGRTKSWIYLAAALVAAASVLFLYVDFTGYVAWNERLMLDRGNTILDSLAAGIRSQSRMGRYESDRLTAIFEELAAAPNILGVRVEDEQGRVLAEGGEDKAYTTPRPGLPVWRKWAVSMAKDFRFLPEQRGPWRGGGGGRGPGMGRGRMMFDDMGQVPPPPDQWGPEGESPPPDGQMDDNPPFGPALMNPEIGNPWGTGDYRLSVCLDVSELEDAFRRGLAGRIAIACGVFLAIGLGVAVASARVRHRDLERDLLLAREQAAHLERLARLGAGLAHETKNPLGVVRGMAQAIGESEDAGGSVKKMTRDIVDEVDRTVGQINTFLTFARPKEMQPARVSLDEFFEKFRPLLQAEAQGSRVAVQYDPSGLAIMADEQSLRRAVLNLTINGVKACGDDGIVRIAAVKSDTTVTLNVSDNGCGMSVEDLGRATEPYFSRFQDGCGLGLAIVDDIARAHGWRLHIDSTEGKGTRVSLQEMRLAGDTT